MSEPTEVQIAETNQGRLVLRGNEQILTDLTAGDPVATRFRSNNETKGKHSIDKFVDGAWRAIGEMFFKEDERGRTNAAHRNCLEIEFWSHISGRTTFDDRDSERVFAIRHDGVVFYKGGAAPAGDDTLVVHDGGRFATAFQGDGNLVTYRRNPDGSLGAAVWASGFSEP